MADLPKPSKRFKVEICQETVLTNGNRSFWKPQSVEKIIFQIILPEEEIDIRAVMQQTVAGRK